MIRLGNVLEFRVGGLGLHFVPCLRVVDWERGWE